MQSFFVNSVIKQRLVWLSAILAMFTLFVLGCQPIQLLDAEGDHSGDAEMAETMSTGNPELGAYIASVATGCGCHFNRDLGGLAGGNEFEGPWGVAYTPNLTPHDTGINQISDDALANAIRIGVSSHGGNLAPPMPRYSGVSDQDVMDLIAYLRSLDPIENEIPERNITGEIPDFAGEAPPAVAPTDPIERGLYLASITRCGRCHTPRNDDGSLDWSRPLAGAPFRDTIAPNLTPDELTGLGEWSDQEIADFLRTGLYSDGTEAHPGMKGQTDRGLKDLTDDDALAIAAFLKSLPPIENLPEPSQ
ncbi:c-type cytochrome [Chloroflexi bacterium TSY]|nr:c-type cytochrome [Chloroflexi bacterium TSY]